MNPYDKCVANKMNEGYQFTICWYVDDIKFCHKNKYIVNDVIRKIESKFDKMTVTHGNVQSYLGMDLEIKNKRAHMNMTEYLKDYISDFPEKISIAANTPATKTIMKVNKYSTPLYNVKTEKFNSKVQKLLHVAKRARFDLQVCTRFLCTRVKYPNKDDWKKLKTVLQYIYGNLNITQILSINSFANMNIFIDASHVPYAEIGASFNNSHFGLLLWGGCFCCFKFGCIQNIVSR